MWRLLRIIYLSGKNWMADNAFKHAGAVSFYTLFSLAPITLIAVTLAGALFGADAARGELSTQLTGLMGEEGALVIEQMLADSRPEKHGWMPGVLGVALLLVGATTVFAQLQESLNAIWGVMARPSRNGFVVLLVRRLLSFALVLTIGFLLLISLILTTVLTVLTSHAEVFLPLPPTVLRALDMLVALTVITVLFAMIFKVLPDVELRWRDVWRGAFITAVLFGVGRTLISIYLGRTGLSSAYGTAGSLVLLLMWIYYSTLILLFGVEFTRAYLIEHGGRVRPKSKAVRVRSVVVPDDDA